MFFEHRPCPLVCRDRIPIPEHGTVDLLLCDEGPIALKRRAVSLDLCMERGDHVGGADAHALSVIWAAV